MSSKRQLAPPDASVPDRLVMTAVEQIRREGMTVSLEHLSFEAIIRESGVSRATAYRHWPTKTDFLGEVLVTVVRSTRLEGESPQEVAELGALIWENRADLGSAQGRRNLVVEALRYSTDADFRRVLASPAWHTYLGLNATFRGLPDGPLRTRVQIALADADTRFVAHRAEVYARLPSLLGYRLVLPLTAPYGFTVMASAAGSMMTGLVVKALARPEIATDTLQMRPFGSTRSAGWTLPAYHLAGVLLSHLEPDPAVQWDSKQRRTSVETITGVLNALQEMRPSDVSGGAGKAAQALS